MQDSSYIIKGGQKGSDRLTIMADATWPTSKYFLERAGMRPGGRVLDIGCGNGEIAKRYAVSILDQKGKIIGLDCDSVKVEAAEKNLSALDIDAVFRVEDLEQSSLEDFGKFDFIYARFILSHMKDPQALIAKLANLLDDGGVLAIEDVDFDGHVSFPQNDSFDKYVQLYKNMGKKRGVDPLIGRKLPLIIKEMGLNIKLLDCVCPSFTDGPGKRMAEITFDLISEGLVKMGLASEEECQAISRDIVLFTERADTLMSVPRIFQVAVTKP